MSPWESDPEKGIDVTPALARAFSEREIQFNSYVAVAQWQSSIGTPASVQTRSTIPVKWPEPGYRRNVLRERIFPPSCTA
jgi:hypothetical protein